MSTNILLKNGTVIIHDDDNRAQPIQNTDVLITKNLIAKIGQNLPIPPDTEVIDCSGKIVSPGFVDTHHHVWQTQLKGYGADNCWVDYFSNGESGYYLLQSFNYTPKDMYWGQLGGCLEAIEAGTTYVLDHAHGCYTAEHADEAVAAFSDSGIRGVFGYGPPFLRTEKWTKDEFVPAKSPIPEDFVSHMGDLARLNPHGEGRVGVGLSFDGYFLPRPLVVGLYEKAVEAGVKVITSHCPDLPGPSIPKLLKEYDLFPSSKNGYSLVLSHGNGLGSDDIATLADANVAMACTPATEAQGCMGFPLLFQPNALTTLGADCQFLNSSSLMQAGRSGLMIARLQRTLAAQSEGKKVLKFDETSERVFNKATIEGARAVGLGGSIGSIKEGKLADILIFGRSSISFGTAAHSDPVTAIVAFSESKDIETVIIDGRIRKRGGKVLAIDKSGQTLAVEDVLRNVQQSQQDIAARRQNQNAGIPKAIVMKMMGGGK